jgi:hypothetical protein
VAGKPATSSARAGFARCPVATSDVPALFGRHQRLAIDEIRAPALREQLAVAAENRRPPWRTCGRHGKLAVAAEHLRPPR